MFCFLTHLDQQDAADDQQYIINDNNESTNEQQSELASRTCPNCSRTYSFRYTMLKHLREDCGKPPAFICKMCDYKSKFKHNLKTHYVRKHKITNENLHIVIES